MMHDFLCSNRDELVTRCREKVSRRPHRSATSRQLNRGVPMFLEQLIRTLRMEQSEHPMLSREISGLAGGIAPSLSEVGETAAQHGRELLQLGFSVNQVVHDYGDLCQSITDLADERDAPFEVDEFRTLNRCLDNAIADAVTEFTYQRDTVVANQQALEVNERLGFFSHELRNSLSTATLAFSALKAGNMPLTGATGSVLERSLFTLQNLVNGSLAHVGSLTRNSPSHDVFSLADFVTELEHAARLDATARGCRLISTPVDPLLALHGDREQILAAVGNLLSNAFKFTHHHTDVTLNAYAVADQILIDVKDHCGGLIVADLEKMFSPFTQHGTDRSGLGLGLATARRSVEANNGTLTVRDEPGTGCVFTVSLPRNSLQ